ncbi:LysE family translocator [Shewanella salipaludis]|uniref:LysE family translocator n=1 Tax=Shewanella salipaludis TaxID=2723052 RepID=A0A972FVX1_9GAMM|nr:LysE family translocator [Shewanella salipaludis]NMH67045.1 LysE family translocator [Shewanella salipaludis]
MVEWNSVLVVFYIYIVGVVIPGPNFVAVTHTAISSSRKHALALVAGIVLVNLFWAASALLGLGTVFKLFPWVALGAKFLGAVYLIWFGFKLIKSANIVQENLSSKSMHNSVMSSFRSGIVVNIVNPKSIAFYAAVFSAAAPSSVNISTLIAMLGVVLAIATIWYGSVALLLSSPTVSNAFNKFKAKFNYLCGTTIVVLGLKQAFSSTGN